MTQTIAELQATANDKTPIASQLTEITTNALAGINEVVFAQHDPDSTEASLALADAIARVANELLIHAGRTYADVKAVVGKEFSKLVESANLVKAEVSKLIKASSTADELPPVVAPQLTLQMLLRLGSTRNDETRAAIDTADTQLSVAEKILQLEKPKKKTPKPPMQWTKNKDGDRQLVLRIPDGDPAMELETAYKKSEAPLQLFIKSLLSTSLDDTSLEVVKLTTEIVEQQQTIRELEALLNEFKPKSHEDEFTAAVTKLTEIAAQIDEVKWQPGMKVKIAIGDYKNETATLNEFDERQQRWWVLRDNDTSGVRILYKEQHLDPVNQPVAA